LTAFMAERWRPAGVRGPVNFCALARLINARISLVIVIYLAGE